MVVQTCAIICVGELAELRGDASYRMSFVRGSNVHFIITRRERVCEVRF